MPGLQRTCSILFVHHGRGYAGGAPVSLVNLIKELKKADHVTMKVVCYDDAARQFFAERALIPVGKLPDPFTHIGKVLIGLARLNSWKEVRNCLHSLFRLPASALRQYRFFREEAPDIIHLNSSTLLSSAIAAKFAHIPIVWHVREIVQGGKYNLRRCLAAGIIQKLATEIIAISPVEARALGSQKRSNITVVYNPYDTTLLNPDVYDQDEEKHALGYAETTVIVLSLGGLSTNKGTYELIEAMRELPDNSALVFAGPPVKWSRFELTKQSLQQLRKKALPEDIVRALKPLKRREFDTEAVFLQCLEKAIEKDWLERYGGDILESAGNRPRRAIRWALAIETLLMQLRIKRACTWYYPQRVKWALDNASENRVRFVGKVKNVAPLLAACDILAFAGTLPHFPRPVYEAGFMKKPVVVFDEQGISDNVDDGITGIIVRDHSAKAIGQALRRLLEQPERIRAIGEAGCRKAHALPNAAEGASAILALYKKLIV